MKILVANLGSTSFKYRLFDLPSEKQLARGGIDRIGQPSSNCFAEIESPGPAIEPLVEQLKDAKTDGEREKSRDRRQKPDCRRNAQR